MKGKTFRVDENKLEILSVGLVWPSSYHKQLRYLSENSMKQRKVFYLNLVSDWPKGLPVSIGQISFSIKTRQGSRIIRLWSWMYCTYPNKYHTGI